MLRLGLLLVLAGSLVLVAADPPGASEWKFDVLHRGVPLKGLVIDQTASSVKIRCITRKPGSPTLVFTETIPRDEVAKMDLLEKEERTLLEQRLESLKQERDMLTEHLRSLDPGEKNKARIPSDAVELRATTWPGNDKLKALSYDSAYFKLIANTRPELARLAAIQLEQIYAAYARALPSRTLTTGRRCHLQVNDSPSYWSTKSSNP